jgi:signal peptidase I
LIVFKLPRALARLTHHQYLPNRGDVIIFNEPTGTDSAISDSKQLVKRVIGLPGDHVVVKNGSLTIFNRQHPNGYSPDKTLPYGSVIGTTAGDVDLVVPANQIFVCGDNRGNSFDSRYFGTVPLSNVIGKLEVRVYPFNQFKFF